MKRILSIVFVLFSTVTFAQSPTALRSLNLTGAKVYSAPVEYNAWAGATIAYPLIGDNKFSTNFGIGGKTVIDFAEFDLGRTWYLLTYGDLGLPNYNRVSPFDNIMSNQEGLGVGLQAYSIFGDLKKSSLTTILNVGAKLNSFGGVDVYSYRFGAGVEISLRGAGLPLIFNLSPAYVLLSEKDQFVKVQSETTDTDIWTSDAFVILPIGDKLGLLVQSTFTKDAKPDVRAGIILSAGL